MSFRIAAPSSCFFCVVAAVVFVANRAAAQVVEPNGVSVPRVVANGEITLGQYFTSQGESIDPVAAASVSPGTFSPLCGFQASLVLSQSGALAGISWYNVPTTSDTAPPVAIYPVVPEGSPDASVASADIRSSPNYAGGLIGFVLTKGGQRVYYSEYKRNANCINCIRPDYWKMALVYPSTVIPDTYYLAFEDWEGANANDWGQNDGDFNDKVFRITGVRCPGGGKPCDTGKQGMCGQGLTECQSNDLVVCKQIVPESPEVCDGVDNDCNGMVDDGDHLCSEGKVCLRGVCVPGCGHGEFTCGPGLICVNGLCVDEQCVDVMCEEGRVCRAGKCVGACDGVVCPGEQVCRVGRCVDPCAGVSCPASRVCQGGVCIEACSCVGCAAGTTCNVHSGRCGSPGCEMQSCDGGAPLCRMGACVDPCSTAACPGGGACVAGVCQDPVAGAGLDGSVNTGLGGGLVISGVGGGAGAPGSGGTAEQGGSLGMGGSPDAALGGASGTALERRQAASSGCGCRLGRSPRASGVAVALLALCWASLRRPLHRRRRVAR